MANCPNCGEASPEGSMHCVHCGSAIDPGAHNRTMLGMSALELGGGPAPPAIAPPKIDSMGTEAPPFDAASNPLIEGLPKLGLPPIASPLSTGIFQSQAMAPNDDRPENRTMLGMPVLTAETIAEIAVGGASAFEARDPEPAIREPLAPAPPPPGPSDTPPITAPPLDIVSPDADTPSVIIAADVDTAAETPVPDATGAELAPVPDPEAATIDAPADDPLDDGASADAPVNIELERATAFARGAPTVRSPADVQPPRTKGREWSAPKPEPEPESGSDANAEPESPPATDIAASADQRPTLDSASQPSTHVESPRRHSAPAAGADLDSTGHSAIPIIAGVVVILIAAVAWFVLGH